MSLDIVNIIAGYGKSVILNRVSTQTKAGQLIGLVGPNGVGKSLLLKVIAGLITPISGMVTLDGHAIATMPAKLRAQKRAWLSQDRSAAWALSVRELVSLGRAPYRGKLGRLSDQGKYAVDAAMAATQCSTLQHHQFDHLSGGEQARVLLARALAVQAPVLLADEPTASLDPFYQFSIMTALQSEARAGKIVIASLHDLRLAKQFCDHVWVLHEGGLIADAQPDLAITPDILAQVFKIKISQSGQVSALEA